MYKTGHNNCSVISITIKHVPLNKAGLLCLITFAVAPDYLTLSNWMLVNSGLKRI